MPGRLCQWNASGKRRPRASPLARSSLATTVPGAGHQDFAMSSALLHSVGLPRVATNKAVRPTPRLAAAPVCARYPTRVVRRIAMAAAASNCELKGAFGVFASRRPPLDGAAGRLRENACCSFAAVSLRSHPPPSRPSQVPVWPALATPRGPASCPGRDRCPSSPFRRLDSRSTSSSCPARRWGSAALLEITSSAPIEPPARPASRPPQCPRSRRTRRPISSGRPSALSSTAMASFGGAKGTRACVPLLDVLRRPSGR